MKKENLISKIEGDRLINEIKERLENNPEIVIEILEKEKKVKEVYKRILSNFKKQEYKIYYLKYNPIKDKKILYHIIIEKNIKQK